MPVELQAFWLAPGSARTASPAVDGLARGVRLLEAPEPDAAAALPLVSASALAATPLAQYARLHTARALLVLGRAAEAGAAFAEVAGRAGEGHLPESAGFGHAEALEVQLDFAGAVAVYDRLLQRRLLAPHVALVKMAAAVERTGDEARALEIYRRVYYEYPLSPESGEAESALTRLNGWDEDDPRPALELKRADVLFQARRWSAARDSYERALEGTSGAERDRVRVRLSACDVHLKRYQQASVPLKGQIAGAHGDEANFFYITALRGLGERTEYVRQARLFADSRPGSPFAEEILNNLASHFIIADEDDRADEVFRLMVERFPDGRFAERAYWRAGWWAYRDGRYADAAALFDRGAARFPRSDYRPSWLYWGGRAWIQAGTKAVGRDRLSLAATDYFNTYYGRLALDHLGGKAASQIASQFGRAPQAPPALPTAERIATLLAAGLDADALRELQYAQRIWGDSPQLTATIALAHNRLGNLRAGINAMKRAYPQWMAAGGEKLPIEIQKIVFPLDYWPLIRKYAGAHRLDPYLVAALVAQESTFDPVIRSSANAVGLMQVLPTTGRQVARQLRISNFSTRRLTDPETNVRLGTKILADGIRKFGAVHYALAAYNAGDHRVTAWRRERGSLPQDVFIDDIPFSETQNYVKRILGTTEDYRRLYGR